MSEFERKRGGVALGGLLAALLLAFPASANEAYDSPGQFLVEDSSPVYAGEAWEGTAPYGGYSGYDVMSGGHGNGCAHGFYECGGCAGEGALMCRGFRFEYLLWWTNGRNAPPLATTSPAGTDRDDAGVLGLPATDILYGDEPIGEQVRNGGRLTYSHLMADQATFLDVRFWGLEDSSETFFLASDGDPILAVPLFNPVLDEEDALLLAFPGVTTAGSLRALSKNDLIGFDAWARQTLCADCCTQIDVFAGYQFTRLDDSLELTASTISIDPQSAVPPGTLLAVRDSFRTQNEFHGGQIGFWSETRHGYCSLEILGKIAIGDMRQSVAIAGSTVVDEPAADPEVAAGGLFARTTNIGEYERHRFVVVPELNINLGYEFKPSWRATVGYTFIYWSNVVLAGNQIDRTVDLSGNPNAASPRFAFHRTDFWAQGVSIGLEHRW